MRHGASEWGSELITSSDNEMWVKWLELVTRAKVAGLSSFVSTTRPETHPVRAEDLEVAYGQLLREVTDIDINSRSKHGR